jgi:thioredoxin 1
VLVREVTDATFEQEVLRAGRPVVVDFWAPWCTPCRAVEPVMAALEDRSRGRVEFAKLNIDDNPVTASRYGVLAIPTAILFADGEPRDTVVGARSPAHYERAWANWLAA